MVHEVRTRSMLVQVTILRSRTKNNHEFKHAADRAMTILLEEALSLVGGYKDHHFSTWSRDCFAGYPMDRLFYAVGVEHENFPLLSILRSLEPCSQSGYICDYCITSDLKTKISNKFETICLPHEIASFRTVFLLLDGLTMGTTVISVFKLLLEFHVKVDRIVIDTLISSIIGIENICNVFPRK
jgi:uracil phosphoribosyltransferase